MPKFSQSLHQVGDNLESIKLLNCRINFVVYNATRFWKHWIIVLDHWESAISYQSPGGTFRSHFATCPRDSPVFSSGCLSGHFPRLPHPSSGWSPSLHPTLFHSHTDLGLMDWFPSPEDMLRGIYRRSQFSLREFATTGQVMSGENWNHIKGSLWDFFRPCLWSLLTEVKKHSFGTQPVWILAGLEFIVKPWESHWNVLSLRLPMSKTKGSWCIISGIE